jgi:hypothetical protein
MFNLLGSLVTLVIGAFIGWTIPEPEWARRVKVKLRDKIGEWFGKEV